MKMSSLYNKFGKRKLTHVNAEDISLVILESGTQILIRSTKFGDEKSMVRFPATRSPGTCIIQTNVPSQDLDGVIHLLLDNSGGVLDGCKFDMGESAGLAIRFRCFRSWSLIRFMYDVK
jgi:hypothetical protein